MSDEKRYPKLVVTSIGNPGGWSPEDQAKVPDIKLAVCAMLAEGLFVSEIALELNIRQGLIREWRAKDPEFNQDYIDCESAWIDQIEKEAVRRAKDGVLEPVVSNGRVVIDPRDGLPMMSRKYSDSLMQFILRGRRRDVYGERKEIEQTTKLDLVGMKEELARRFVVLDGTSE